jgi:xylulokinase
MTGNPALPGFTAPKILWVRKNWPDALARAAHLLLPKDFIRRRLTGVVATDVSDASGTLLFDVAHRRWALGLVRALGIDETLLPPAFEGDALTGAVLPDVASALGLVAGTPVVAGGSDNAAAAVGLAAVDPGVLTLSIGTSGVIFAPLDRYPAMVDGRLHVFCHALPGRWHLMSVTLAAGGSLHWLRDLFEPLLPVAGDVAYDWLTAQAAEAPAGSDGLVYLPYLTGERTPIADPTARGVFFGLHMGHRLPHVVRAVLEGVAFSQRQGLDLMREAGAATTVARGAGGGLASPVWRQILADALGVGLQLAGPGTGAARGAAVLAGLGVGMYDSPAVGMAWDERPVEAPDAAGSAALEGPYRRYEALYPALAPVFRSAAE